MILLFRCAGIYAGNSVGASGAETPDTVSQNDHTMTAGGFNYVEALQKSLFFFDAQRSGKLPDHFRVSWRGDSALDDGRDAGIDLSGGYYDAGDHMKFALPMASAMTLLAWGGVEYGAGYRKAAQWFQLLEAIRWGTDWIMKAHTSDHEFYGQVGHPRLDHSFWGPPEVMTMDRPAFKIDARNPGSELAAEAAAALAAASILFESYDPVYAQRLVAHARTLFDFAGRYRGTYIDAIPCARDYYNSRSGYYDELVWSAAWLYRATAEDLYLRKAESLYAEHLANAPPRWTHSWDDKSYGAAVLLAQLTGARTYRNAVQRWLNYFTIGDGDDRIRYTPGGLAWWTHGVPSATQPRPPSSLSYTRILSKMSAPAIGISQNSRSHISWETIRTAAATWSGLATILLVTPTTVPPTGRQQTASTIRLTIDMSSTERSSGDPPPRMTLLTATTA